MNKNIKELMGKTLDKKFSYTWTVLDYPDLEVFSEHFAELIVRECIAQCNDGDSQYFIAKHFGVE